VRKHTEGSKVVPRESSWDPHNFIDGKPALAGRALDRADRAKRASIKVTSREHRYEKNPKANLYRSIWQYHKMTLGPNRSTATRTQTFGGGQELLFNAYIEPRAQRER